LFGGDIVIFQSVMPTLLEMAGNWQGISARAAGKGSAAGAPFHQFTMRKNIVVMTPLVVG
jgi:hypothetical protein